MTQMTQDPHQLLLLNFFNLNWDFKIRIVNNYFKFLLIFLILFYQQDKEINKSPEMNDYCLYSIAISERNLGLIIFYLPSPIFRYCQNIVIGHRIRKNGE